MKKTLFLLALLASFAAKAQIITTANLLKTSTFAPANIVFVQDAQGGGAFYQLDLISTNVDTTGGAAIRTPQGHFVKVKQGTDPLSPELAIKITAVADSNALKSLSLPFLSMANYDGSDWRLLSGKSPCDSIEPARIKAIPRLAGTATNALDLSKVQRNGNTIYGFLDARTDETISATRVTQWFDGQAMTDAKCDGVIYFKANNGEYFKRVFGDYLDSAWFFTYQNGNDASTSGSDDSANLRAIFELGRLMKKRVLLRRPNNPNQQYRLDNPLVFGVDDINIEAEEGTVLNGTNINAGYIMYIVGNITPTTTLSTALTKISSDSIKVASVSGFVVGDWIQIKSTTERYDEQRTNESIFKAEFNKVVAINATTNTLWLDQPTTDTYLATTTNISKVRWCRNISFKNITFKGKGATDPKNTLLQISQGFNVNIDNCAFIDGSKSGLSISNCYNATIRHSRAERINQLNFGDGFVVNGSYFVNVLDCYFADGRHGFDSGNIDVNRHLTVHACKVVNMWASGLSQHGGADYTIFSDNQILNCGGGIVNRSRNFTAINNLILGANHKYPLGLNNYYEGILIGDGQNNDGFKGKGGIGLKLIGNTIENCDGSAIGILAELKGAIISNNIAKGFKWEAIELSNGILHENVIISNNVFDCSSQNDTTHANAFNVYQVKAGISTALKNFTVKDNQFLDILGNGFFLTSGFSGNRSTLISVENNLFTYRGNGYDIGKYAINIAGGSSDIVSVQGNKFIGFANLYNWGNNNVNANRYVSNFYQMKGSTSYNKEP